MDGVREAREVRKVEELEGIDGLIIPGGESTSMVLIAEASNMIGPLRNFVHTPHKAVSVVPAWNLNASPPPFSIQSFLFAFQVWGTCAGLILLSERLDGQKEGGQAVLGGLNVTTSRNFFGRQIDSFTCDLKTEALGKEPFQVRTAKKKRRKELQKKKGKNCKKRGSAFGRVCSV